MQSGVGFFLSRFKTGISGIDNFISCPFKMTNSYLKEWPNTDTNYQFGQMTECSFKN